MRVFYSTVSTAAEAGVFSILLDGQVLRSPARSILPIQNQALADCIANEWRAQKKIILPATMPLTQILMTMVDQVMPQRASCTHHLLRYIETDLLLYTSESGTVADFVRGLRAPYLQGFNQRYGAQLVPTTGFAPHILDTLLQKRLRKSCDDLAAELFCILYLMTDLCGSFILADAFLHGADDKSLAKAVRAEDVYYNMQVKNPDLEGDLVRFQKEAEQYRQFLSLSGAQTISPDP